jgi:hypothetical protein
MTAPLGPVVRIACNLPKLAFQSIHLEAQDPLDAPSHAGRINLFNRATELIERSKP